MPEEKTVLIHGNEWKFSHLIDAIEDCRKATWNRQKWTYSPALFEKSGGGSRKYHGQKYDPEKFDLVQDGWGHDHCEICWWTLEDSSEEEHNTGYTDGRNWVCSECFNRFLNEKIDT